jgi:DNA-binding XRE family transcriptional regulator
MEAYKVHADISSAPEGIPEREYEPRHQNHKTPNTLELLGINLRARRRHKKLTKKAFAKALGISIKTYSGIADGTGNPTYETLLRIAIALNLTIHIGPSRN